MDEAVKKYMSQLGKKSWEARKKTADMSKLGKLSAAKKRAKKENKPIAKKTGNMPFTLD